MQRRPRGPRPLPPIPTSAASPPQPATPSTTGDGTPSSAPAISSDGNSSTVLCAACREPMSGQFVRALGSQYHLACFSCIDCGKIAAAKFFPIDRPDGTQAPLCETDYFRRLDLICGKCGSALRGSYITACNKKWHVEHFSCGDCDIIFSATDTYYEGANPYCHFHWSTRYASRCTGCRQAILKQFVDLESKKEEWHPECYMISKFWNVRLARQDDHLPSTAELEEQFNEETLKKAQDEMEVLVYRIWTVLSDFEESSAGCISDMLRHIGDGHYLASMKSADDFILHVEVLFAAIDEIEMEFIRLGERGMSHVREARQLCKKIVGLFTLLTTVNGPSSMTQELLALVTGLAHYLKIFIRIALTGALRLKRDHSNDHALNNFLDQLFAFAKSGKKRSTPRPKRTGGADVSQEAAPDGTQLAYGYHSLNPTFTGPFLWEQPSAANYPSDLCLRCGLTVEEDCVRAGPYQRWHSYCVQCRVCHKTANHEPTRHPDEDPIPRLSAKRRPPADVNNFSYTYDGDSSFAIYCKDHSNPTCTRGFFAVSRLEQYAYLLVVALQRLYGVLRDRGLVPTSTSENVGPRPEVRVLVQDSSDETPALTPAGIPTSNGAERDSLPIPHNPFQNLPTTPSPSRTPRTSLIDEGPTSRPASPGHVEMSPDRPGPMRAPTIEASETGTSTVSLRSIVDDIVFESYNPSNLSGSYCDLFIGKHSEFGRVALKRPRRPTDYTEADIRRFLREADIWARVRHRWILTFFGTYECDGFIYMVSPFMENGTLSSFLSCHPEADRARLLREIAEGVAHLHDCDVVHGDLKAANVLISDDHHAQITDFGLSKYMSTSSTSLGLLGAGTVRWQSPELFENQPKSFASDIYAFGMVIFEVLNGKPPFVHLTTPTAVLVSVFLHDERPAKEPASSPSGISYAPLWAVAERCWPRAPEDRLPMAQVAELLQEDKLSSFTNSAPPTRVSKPMQTPAMHVTSAKPIVTTPSHHPQPSSSSSSPSSSSWKKFVGSWGRKR